MTIPPLPPLPRPPGSRGAWEVLDQARAGRLVLQDFRPLADGLEWELGGRYWHEQGSQAFVGSEPVPFLINNDGNQSVKAAEVFLASLAAAEKEGHLPADAPIFVLELGPGVGLFARFFLDWVRARSDEQGRDWYDRVVYVLADRSERMLRDLGRHGVLGSHSGRYRLRTVDAVRPADHLLKDADVAAQGPRPYRAVFLNYVLDCLPAGVYKAQGEEVRELVARTSIAPEPEQWRPFLDVRAEELRQLAASHDPEERRQLTAVFHLLLSEYQYRRAEEGTLYYPQFLLPALREAEGRPVLLNHGAIRCLEGLLGMLAEGGFILVNDYGQDEGLASEGFEHQRFARSTSVGLNFPLLARYFRETRRPWIAPEEGQEASLFSRLLCRQVVAEVAERFANCFHERTRRWHDEPAQRARELVRVGRLQAALGSYREALERQPFNWALMAESAHLLTFGLRAPLAGLAMARQALSHNPGSSAEVWNTAGDALYALGRLEEARHAYGRALGISPGDVRARYNLAFVHARAGEHEQALTRIAEALARDRGGSYREALIQKQAEVLALLDAHHQRVGLGMADRVSGEIEPWRWLEGRDGKAGGERGGRGGAREGTP